MSPEPSDMLAEKFVHRIFSIQDQESATLKATMCPIGRPAWPGSAESDKSPIKSSNLCRHGSSAKRKGGFNQPLSILQSTRVAKTQSRIITTVEEVANQDMKPWFICSTENTWFGCLWLTLRKSESSTSKHYTNYMTQLGSNEMILNMPGYVQNQLAISWYGRDSLVITRFLVRKTVLGINYAFK